MYREQAFLPHVYFCPKWHALAEKMVYSKAPQYLGHVSLLPEPEMFALAHDRDRRYILTKDKAGVIRCFDARCRHEGSMLIDPTATPAHSCPREIPGARPLIPDVTEGKRKMLICPLHQWTWNLDGSLLGCPGFKKEELPISRKKLIEVPIRIWNGLIYTNVNGKLPWEDEMQSYRLASYFDLSDYFFGGMLSSTYACSHHLFNEVYGDTRHVKKGHDGSFGAIMDMSRFSYFSAKTFNVQEVGFYPKPRTANVSAEYNLWHGWVLRLSNGKVPEYGALWEFEYPFSMREAYPWSHVISIMDPIAADRSVNRCYFFYPNELKRMVKRGELTEQELNQFIYVQQAAYKLTAAEDEDFIMRIARGRKIAYENKEDFRGLPHPVEEAGVHDYDEYYADVERVFQSEMIRDL